MSRRIEFSQKLDRVKAVRATGLGGRSHWWFCWNDRGRKHEGFQVLNERKEPTVNYIFRKTEGELTRGRSQLKDVNLFQFHGGKKRVCL